MNIKEACNRVAEIVGGRQYTHGPATFQLAHSAMLKNAVGHRRNTQLSPPEIEAIDMICVKLSRLANGEPIEDHYLDIMGYAAIGLEARGEIEDSGLKPSKAQPAAPRQTRRAGRKA